MTEGSVTGINTVLDLIDSAVSDLRESAELSGRIAGKLMAFRAEALRQREEDTSN